MSKNHIVLLVFLCGLGGLFFWDQMTPKEEMKKEPGSSIISFDQNAVTSIEIRDAKLNIVAEKNKKTWSITSPIKSSADSAMIEQLIETLATAKSLKTLDGASDLSLFGLKSPSRTVYLFAGEAQLTDLKIGNRASVGSGVYVCSEDCKKIYLASQAIDFSTSKSLFELRSKSLLNDDFPLINELIINQESQKEIVIERLSSENDNLKMIRPFIAEASKNREASFLDTLSANIISEFFDNPEKEHGRPKLPNKISLSISLKTNQNLDYKWAFYKVSPDEVYMVDQKNKAYFRVSPDSYQKLEGGPQTWLDLKMADFSSQEISKIKLGPVFFENRDQSWQAVGESKVPTPEVLKSEKVQEIVDVLLGLEGVEQIFNENLESHYKSAKADFVIEFELNTSAARRWSIWKKQDSSEFYFRKEKDQNYEGLFLVSGSELEQLEILGPPFLVK